MTVQDVINRLVGLRKRWLLQMRRDRSKTYHNVEDWPEFCRVVNDRIENRIFWITPQEYKILKRWLREQYNGCPSHPWLNFAEPRLFKIFGHLIQLKYALLTGG